MSRRPILFLAIALILTLAQSLGVRAEEPPQRVMRLGFVGPLSASNVSRYNGAFWTRLSELGWVEGRNLVVESRAADGHLERLPALIADVIDRKVDVLVTYGMPAAIAAKKATATVPIVVAIMPDPVSGGLVSSLARPGGNLTGMSGGDPEIDGKMLELLQEIVPRLSSVAVIVNPNNQMTSAVARNLVAIAPARGLKLHLLELREAGGLERAFDQARLKARAVVVIGEPITIEHQARVTALAAKHRLPAIYLDREYVKVGGLITYGPVISAMWQRAAEYVDKILKGAKPGDLPIEQPKKFELVVNLKTAKKLGLTIPESILVRADEVIR